MPLSYTPIASLISWSCSEQSHDASDRLLIHTDWDERLVAMAHCDGWHESGRFVMDPMLLPTRLQDELRDTWPIGATNKELPPVHIQTSPSLYGRQGFKIELEACTPDQSLRVISSSCVTAIEATTVQDLEHMSGALSGYFAYVRKGSL